MPSLRVFLLQVVFIAIIDSFKGGKLSIPTRHFPTFDRLGEVPFYAKHKRRWCRLRHRRGGKEMSQSRPQTWLFSKAPNWTRSSLTLTEFSKPMRHSPTFDSLGEVPFNTRLKEGERKWPKHTSRHCCFQQIQSTLLWRWESSPNQCDTPLPLIVWVKCLFTPNIKGGGVDYVIEEQYWGARRGKGSVPSTAPDTGST